VCGSRPVVTWKSANHQGALRPEDLRITDDRYGVTLELFRCSSCGFVFADPLATSRLLDLYRRLDDDAYEAGESYRAMQMRKLVGRLHRDRPDARSLLDVGAANGLLVAAAGEVGMVAEGVEPSQPLTAAALDRGQVVHEGTLPHPALVGRDFDLVTLVDVLEHVADPVGFLTDAAAQVSPGGAVLVITPDVASVPSRLLGRRWWHLRLAHVGYFDRRSLTTALAAAGLRPVSWYRPRWYFQIGYLAERVARYLPVGGLVRFLGRHKLTSWVLDRSIPLNLHDSLGVIAEPVRSTVAAER